VPGSGTPGYPGYPAPGPAHPGPAPGYPASGPAYPGPGSAYPGSGPAYGAPPPPPPGFGPPPGDPLGLPPGPRKDPMAIAAMGVGISSIVLALFACCCTQVAVLGIVAGAVGAIIGFLARKRVLESQGVLGGAQQALIGMVTGGIGAALAVVLIVFAQVVVSNDFS
jgi:hypothetical protein